MTESYELRTGSLTKSDFRNRGKFTKGHTPWCKGRSWSEWMPEEHQARVKAIGLKNLEKGHSHDPRGWATYYHPVIAIDAEGRMSRFEGIKQAAEHFRCCRCNISRCCRLNRQGTEPTGTRQRINTDHRYMGIRFYYEDDVQLWSKARRKNY